MYNINQEGDYPIPSSTEAQQSLLISIANGHILREWNKILNGELEYLKKICAKSDIDFEFVINLPNNGLEAHLWEKLLKNFGQYWIEDILNPNRNDFINLFLILTCGLISAGPRWRVFVVEQRP